MDAERDAPAGPDFPDFPAQQVQQAQTPAGPDAPVAPAGPDATEPPGAFAPSGPRTAPFLRGRAFLATRAAPWVLAVPALALFAWLALTCLDFIGLARGGSGAAGTPWIFGLRAAQGVVLPPLLAAALRPPSAASLREAGRAALIAFFLFTIGFFATAGTISRLWPGTRAALLPFFLMRLAPLVMCVLLPLAWSLALRLLPPEPALPEPALPEPASPSSAPGRSFGRLNTALALLLFALSFSPAALLGPNVPFAAFGLVFPLDVVIFLALGRIARRAGARPVRLFYALACCCGPWGIWTLAPWIFFLPPLWLGLHALASLLALAALLALCRQRPARHAATA